MSQGYIHIIMSQGFLWHFVLMELRCADDLKLLFVYVYMQSSIQGDADGGSVANMALMMRESHENTFKLSLTLLMLKANVLG